jgi:hypothetical protein
MDPARRSCDYRRGVEVVSAVCEIEPETSTSTAPLLLATRRLRSLPRRSHDGSASHSGALPGLLRARGGWLCVIRCESRSSAQCALNAVRRHRRRRRLRVETVSSPLCPRRIFCALVVTSPSRPVPARPALFGFGPLPAASSTVRLGHGIYFFLNPSSHGRRHGDLSISDFRPGIVKPTYSAKAQFCHIEQSETQEDSADAANRQNSLSSTKLIGKIVEG